MKSFNIDIFRKVIAYERIEITVKANTEKEAKIKALNYDNESYDDCNSIIRNIETESTEPLEDWRIDEDTFEEVI